MWSLLLELSKDSIITKRPLDSPKRMIERREREGERRREKEREGERRREKEREREKGRRRDARDI